MPAKIMTGMHIANPHIVTGQVMAAGRWLAAREGPISLQSIGPRTSVIALAAAGLQPQ